MAISRERLIEELAHYIVEVRELREELRLAKEEIEDWKELHRLTELETA